MHGLQCKIRWLTHHDAAFPETVNNKGPQNEKSDKSLFGNYTKIGG